MKKSIVAVGDQNTRPRPSRRLGLAALVVGLALFLPACASGTAGSGPEPETTTNQAATETTTVQEAAGANSGSGETSSEAVAGAEQATANYTVSSITCPSCAARVKANAQSVPGVLDVQVDGQRVAVGYDPEQTDPEKIAGAIRDGGDTVVPA